MRSVFEKLKKKIIVSLLLGAHLNCDCLSADDVVVDKVVYFTPSQREKHAYYELSAFE